MRTMAGCIAGLWMGAAHAADVGHLSFSGPAPRHPSYGGDVSVWVAAIASGNTLAEESTGLGVLQAGALSGRAWFGLGVAGITVEVVDMAAAVSLGGAVGLRSSNSADGPSYAFLADVAWRGGYVDHAGATFTYTRARQALGQWSWVGSLGGAYGPLGPSMWVRGEGWLSWPVRAGGLRLSPAIGGLAEYNGSRNAALLILAIRLGAGLAIGQAPPWNRLAEQIEG